MLACGSIFKHHATSEECVSFSFFLLQENPSEEELLEESMDPFVLKVAQLVDELGMELLDLVPRVSLCGSVEASNAHGRNACILLMHSILSCWLFFLAAWVAERNSRADGSVVCHSYCVDLDTQRSSSQSVADIGWGVSSWFCLSPLCIP